jgi:ankyrin repeat protein
MDTVTAVLKPRTNSSKVSVAVSAHSLNQNLVYFAGTRNYDVVRYLLDNGEDPNIKTNGVAALHNAVTNDDFMMAKLLLNRGADVNITTDNLGNTALHIAAVHGSLRLIKLLVSRGAKIDAVNSEGCTPLFWASIDLPESAEKILIGTAVQIGKINRKQKYLIEHGANPNIRDNFERGIQEWAIHIRTQILNVVNNKRT